MWSDPDDIDNWAVSPRGAGWLFGGDVTREVRLAIVSISVSPQVILSSLTTSTPSR